MPTDPNIVLLSGAEKGGLAIMILVLMAGMGATLTWSDFRMALKHPKGLIIGFLSQFGLMPLIAFGLAHLFKLPNEAALSLILVGSTPGGTTSNLFAYYSRGDVALSISMTVASTFAAVIMMPVVLSVYATPFTGAELTVPIKNIIITLVLVLVPVSIGMFVRHKSQSAAAKLEKAGSIIGIIVIVFLIFEYVFKNSAMFMQTGLNFYMSAILLGIVGFIFGYGVSKLTGLPERQARTVSLETGIQNTPLTIGIISLSFPAAMQNKLLWLPVIYAIFIVINSCLISLVYRKMKVPHADD